jgi:hypothetical protein
MHARLPLKLYVGAKLTFDELYLMNYMHESYLMKFLQTLVSTIRSTHVCLQNIVPVRTVRSIVSLSFKAIFLVPAGTKAKNKSILTRTKT